MVFIEGDVQTIMEANFAALLLTFGDTPDFRQDNLVMALDGFELKPNAANSVSGSFTADADWDEGDLNNLSDGIYPVSFDRGDVFGGASGIYMNAVHVYTQDWYDLMDDCVALFQSLLVLGKSRRAQPALKPFHQAAATTQRQNQRGGEAYIAHAIASR